MSETSALQRRPSTRIVWIALLAAAMLLIPAGLARASGPNGTLRGFITDAATSAAVAGASVQVSASDVNWVFEATTDATGYYALSVPNHEYTIQVSHPLYSVNATAVNVGSGQNVWANVTLASAPSRSAVIQGYVTDSVSSTPVTVGQVVLTSVSYASPSYTNASSLNATGFYGMALVPGTYRLSTAGVDGYAPFTHSYLYPSAGNTLWYNFSLTPSPLASWINGTVEDGGNYSALVGANVTASVGGLSLGTVQSNATGGYSLHVPTGSIEITADAAGHAPYTTTIYVYSAGAYSRYLYLDPLSAGERGWVRDGLTGAPIPGAAFVATPFWSTGYFDQAITNSTGFYALHLTADDFALSVTATGYTTWWAYDFLSTGETMWRNVTLWPIISTVQGYVVDGLTGAHMSGVYVYGYDARSGYSASRVSDPSGFYSMAFPPSPAITLRVTGTPPYAGVLVYADTRPYGITWANLTVARLDAALQVNVTDGTTGSPIPSAYVSASWYFGYSSNTTDAGGLATTDVPSGLPLSLYVSATGYFAWSGTMDPVFGSRSITVVLNPSLPFNVTVQGYVLDGATLLPISTAFVQAFGYNGSAPWDYTDYAGYYSFNIVAAPQTIEATVSQHGPGFASVAPIASGTIWVNFTLAQDATGPRILNFSANPSVDVGPSQPTMLHADVNETNLSTTDLSVYRLWATSANVGTFLDLGSIPAQNVSVAPTAPGNASISSRYYTRTPSLMLSDGISSTWWPESGYLSTFQDVVSGYFDNATLSSPAYSTAVFDLRDGRLLYVTMSGQVIDPIDQPSATFTPYAGALQIDMTSAAVVGWTVANGPSFQIGSLGLSVSQLLPAGQYAAVLEAQDAAGNYAQNATFFQVTADTTPPVADAGPNQAVDQRTLVTLDGTASTDNVGIASFTWTFTDGGPKVLQGVVVHYTFVNAGIFTVTLTVSDAAGNSAADTMTVTVRDTTPPAVAFTTPIDGANVSGAIGVAAAASDNVGVVRVEFLVDGVPRGNATTAPFSLTLDTTTLANGNHTIEAVAYDAAGNSATASLVVRVGNSPSGGLGPFLGSGAMPWILLAIVLVAAGALGAVLLVRRRKRRASAPMGPPPAGPLPPPPPAP